MPSHTTYVQDVQNFSSIIWLINYCLRPDFVYNTLYAQIKPEIFKFFIGLHKLLSVIILIEGLYFVLQLSHLGKYYSVVGSH